MLGAIGSAPRLTAGFITGITGQDGSLLAEALVADTYAGARHAPGAFRCLGRRCAAELHENRPGDRRARPPARSRASRARPYRPALRQRDVADLLRAARRRRPGPHAE